MQLLPTTAADSNVGIPDISEPDTNIHAGIQYLDWIRAKYFNDPEIERFNQPLFALQPIIPALPVSRNGPICFKQPEGLCWLSPQF